MKIESRNHSCVSVDISEMDYWPPERRLLKHFSKKLFA